MLMHLQQTVRFRILVPVEKLRKSSGLRLLRGGVQQGAPQRVRPSWAGLPEPGHWMVAERAHSHPPVMTMNSIHGAKEGSLWTR